MFCPPPPPNPNFPLPRIPLKQLAVACTRNSSGGSKGICNDLLVTYYFSSSFSSSFRHALAIPNQYLRFKTLTLLFFPLDAISVVNPRTLPFPTPIEIKVAGVMASGLLYTPRPLTDIFTHDTDIDRRQCKRTVPMKVLALGLGRTGTACRTSLEPIKPKAL